MAGDRLERNFGKLHALHVAAFTRHLIECRHACDGDLDLFLVLTIIGERTFSPQFAPEAMTHTEFLEGTVGSVEPLAINLQSIADYSGIPRETVRRKIAELEAKGWVQRGPDGFITATRAASADLEPLTRSSITYVAGMMKLFRQVFAQPPG